ncbi:MAG: DUF6468 domain-containing protein [Alphaproteobacteria bacterium]
MTLSLIVDGLIVLLLAAAIGFGILLSRRLRALRGAQAELVRSTAELNEATGNTQLGISELKAMSERLADSLDAKIENAQRLDDDLTFLIQRAEDVSGGLQRMVKKGSPSGRASRGRDSVKRELLKALRAAG